jgi:hypothetical protein
VADGSVAIVAVDVDDPIIAEKTPEIEGQLGGFVGVVNDRPGRHSAYRTVELALVALAVHVELALRIQAVDGEGAGAARLRRARKLRDLVPSTLEALELDLGDVERRVLGAADNEERHGNGPEHHAAADVRNFTARGKRHCGAATMTIVWTTGDAVSARGR